MKFIPNFYKLYGLEIIRSVITSSFMNFGFSPVDFGKVHEELIIRILLCSVSRAVLKILAVGTIIGKNGMNHRGARYVGKH